MSSMQPINLNLRLLSTEDWTFHPYTPGDKFCILSHRWADDAQEIPYEDVLFRNWNETTTGYRKLTGACRKALELGYEWIWIDTCCINRANEAELSESIRSMFQWYAAADECIVYLADVYTSNPDTGSPSLDTQDEFRSELELSSWFRRGWTLQELIAPASVTFYNNAFENVGTKHSLADVIADITGIASCYLTEHDTFRTASIATRLSWASRRETKKREDEAYCLLGIMGVSMPVQYGDGEMAFRKLQIELLRNSCDESIFAWLPSDCSSNSQLYGPLAHSPKDFASSKDIVQFYIPGNARRHYEWTNKGLMIYRRSQLPANWSRTKITDLVLTCKRKSDRRGALLVLWLVKLQDSWYRWGCMQHCFKYDENRSFLSQTRLDPLNSFTQYLYISSPEEPGMEGRAAIDAGLFALSRRAKRTSEVVTFLAVTALGMAVVSQNTQSFSIAFAATCGVKWGVDKLKAERARRSREELLSPPQSGA